MRGPCARRTGAPIDAPPTLRQREVLQAIADFQELHRYAPTVRDLCRLLEIVSTKGVSDHLDLLERRGLITREKHVARSLRLTLKGLREMGLVIELAEGVR
jgi:repressor LexA